RICQSFPSLRSRSHAIPSPPAPTSFLHEWKARDDCEYLYKSPATTAARRPRFFRRSSPAPTRNSKSGSTRLRQGLRRGRPRTRSTNQESSSATYNRKLGYINLERRNPGIDQRFLWPLGFQIQIWVYLRNLRLRNGIREEHRAFRRG